MRAGSFALMATLAVATTAPAAGQIADRTGQNRDRNAVVVRPEEARRDGERGRATGAEVVDVVAERARWNTTCTEYRRDRRDGRHGWFDEDGRYDCEYRDARYGDRDGRYDRDGWYGRDRRPVGVVVRTSLAREHVAFLTRLDREHDRWHRVHGWQPRNRGWYRSHAALHRNLERDHERWHRRLGVPFTLWPDRVGHYDVSGIGRGVVVIR